MKRSPVCVVALGAFLLCTGLAAAPSPSAPPPAPAPSAPKLFRIATLRTVEANQNFQADVQLLRAQREAMIELEQALAKEKNAAKKKELKTKLDEVTATLNANNEKAKKSYGFSLARNYTMEIEVSHIYLILTPEEAAAIEKAQAAEKAKAAPPKP